MLLLADIDLGDLLIAMVAFFFLFLAIWLFIVLFADIFGRRDLSGWGKAELDPADLHPSADRNPDLLDRPSIGAAWGSANG